MNKIKVLLVDDEYLALNLLEEFISKVPELEIVGKEKSPMNALEILMSKDIDLLFLDIQMPTLSGNNLLKTLKNPPLTIFTTAYSEYAIEAFDLNVIDYLLKPFSFERFLQSVIKAKEQLNFRHQPPVIATAPIPISPALPTHNFLSVKVDGKIIKIWFKDILFIEGLKEYVRIFTTKGKFVTLESMKNLEHLLPAHQFIRVHKSYIVAKDKVQSMQGCIIGLNEYKIPVSRAKKDEVLQQIFH